MELHSVSIRRADRCLVEGNAKLCQSLFVAWFQSAVRIAVWLKMITIRMRIIFMRFQSAVRIAVWLKT